LCHHNHSSAAATAHNHTLSYHNRYLKLLIFCLLPVPADIVTSGLYCLIGLHGSGQVCQVIRDLVLTETAVIHSAKEFSQPPARKNLLLIFLL
jgi:hypothetical protein